MSEYRQSVGDFPNLEAIEVNGVPNADAKSFQVNLRSVTEDYLLHFNVRFDEHCVVRNSTQDGGLWLHEERDGGMPFGPGQAFKAKFAIRPDADGGEIDISVDGKPFVVFKLRDDIKQLSAVEVFGDVKDVLVDFIQPHAEMPKPQPQVQPEPAPQPGVNPNSGHIVHPVQPHPGQPGGGHPQHPGQPQPGQPQHPGQPQPGYPGHPQPAQPAPGQTIGLPYNGPLTNFAQTQRLRIVGTPVQHAQRFTVNFKLPSGDVVFHYNPRFDTNCVAQNSTQAGQYGPEEGVAGCPFQPGRRFALDFLVHGNVVRVFVDGVETSQFNQRENIFSAAVLEIHGDIQLENVMIA